MHAKSIIGPCDSPWIPLQGTVTHLGSPCKGLWLTLDPHARDYDSPWIPLQGTVTHLGSPCKGLWLILDPPARDCDSSWIPLQGTVTHLGSPCKGLWLTLDPPARDYDSPLGGAVVQNCCICLICVNILGWPWPNVRLFFKYATWIALWTYYKI